MLETEVLMDGCSYGWMTGWLACWLTGWLTDGLRKSRELELYAMRSIPSRHSTFVIVMKLYSTKHVSSTDSKALFI